MKCNDLKLQKTFSELHTVKQLTQTNDLPNVPTFGFREN
jgi:hypothetical protein